MFHIQSVLSWALFVLYIPCFIPSLACLEFMSLPYLALSHPTLPCLPAAPLPYPALSRPTLVCLHDSTLSFYYHFLPCLPNPTLPCFIPPYSALSASSYRILFYPTLLCPIWLTIPYPVLPHPTLVCLPVPTLPCSVLPSALYCLPYSVLFYNILPCPTRPAHSKLLLPASLSLTRGSIPAMKFHCLHCCMMISHAQVVLS